MYGFARTNLSGVNNTSEFYLSKKVDPFGAELRFQYPDYDPDETYGQVVLLKRVVDVDSRTNTLAYTNATFPTLITGVTDAFGRTASLIYDASPHLTNITDVAGLSSQFAYDSSGWITNLTTPYGTTTFEHSDLGEDFTLAYNRYVKVTEPNLLDKHQYCRAPRYSLKSERFSFTMRAEPIP